MLRLPTDQLRELRDAFRVHKPIEKSDDAIEERLAEELRSAGRLIEVVEHELEKRGANKRELEAAESMIEEVAKVIEAKDDCDAIDRVSDDMKRRLLRRSMDGRGTKCDNRSGVPNGSRIRRRNP
ncbi:hypothetical protein [Erythrobacter sp.]|jgi:hypothetical protein|uniref:hypothetical protein n=1 Tax=Erythrobacter sp. TaxID=1042 RepID=UPI002EAF9D37|nr:hypothetical protein [Erythrobacter sp.]